MIFPKLRVNERKGHLSFKVFFFLPNWTHCSVQIHIDHKEQAKIYENDSDKDILFQLGNGFDLKTYLKEN